MLEMRWCLHVVILTGQGRAGQGMAGQGRAGQGTVWLHDMEGAATLGM